MTTIVRTIRSDTPEMRPRLPDTRSIMPGARVTIEYKRSGNVVFTEDFVCTQVTANDCETLKQWTQLK